MHEFGLIALFHVMCRVFKGPYNYNRCFFIQQQLLYYNTPLGILCIAHQNIDYNRVIKTVYVCLHSSLITRGSVLFRGTMVSAQGRDTMCGCPSVKKKQNMSGL